MNEFLYLASYAVITILCIGMYFVSFRIVNTQSSEEISKDGHRLGALKSDKVLLSIQQKAENSVVQIFAVSSIFNWLQPFKAPIQITISGSGFFINEEGYFVTNSHVVDQARSIWIQVPTLGRRNIDADVISVCPDRDLALVKVRKEGLEEIKSMLGFIPYLEFADSDKVSRTDKALVLGYPLGQHYLKATTGIVSGKEHIEEQLFIQIDAAINPGSSGGPVLNESGEVIGITTVMIPTAQNVGYIIPINELKIILEDMYKNSFLRKQSLGISFNNSTLEQINYLNNPLPGGLYVNKVYKNSIAQKAGIEPGDMIYEINKCEVDIYADVKVPWSTERIPFIDMISELNKGQEVSLKIYRKGEKVDLKFKFENGALNPVRIIYPEYEKIDFEVVGGLVVMQLTENHVQALFSMIPELIKYEDPKNQTEPILIISYVLPGAEINRLQALQPGDVIETVNEIKVNTLNDFRQALKQSLKTGYLAIKTDNSSVVLNIIHVLRDEYRLSQDYKYPLSQTVKELIHYMKIPDDIESKQHIN